MSNYLAGIDYSMTSPAVCIYDASKKFHPDNCLFFVYSSMKKLNQLYGRNVFITQHELYECDEQRFDQISEWSMAILNKFKVKEVCLEGYSMGSQGRVFAIAENAGLLKQKMYQADIKFVTPAPTQVKKHFTGKGNATKPLMHEAFYAKTNISIISLVNIEPDKSPVSDIVDSNAMLDWYLANRG